MEKNKNSEITDGVLIAFLEKDLEPDRRAVVQQWIQAHPENKKAFERVKKTWELTAAIEPKPVVVNTEKAWDVVFDKISKEKEEVPVVSLETRRVNRKIYLGVAAMVVVLVGVFSIVKFLNFGEDTIRTVAEEKVVVDQLADGSSVTLSQNSVLTYPEEFDENERRVSMSGEAFFDIARDESKPFIIDLPNETFVEVLGTSFNIVAAEEGGISEVEVMTGKVAFGKGENTIELIPGETGRYDAATGTLSKVEKEINQINTERTTSLDFDNTPLIEAVAVLNEVHTDSVEFNCPAAYNEKWDGDATGISLEKAIELIEASFPVKARKTEEKNQTIYVLECD